MRTKRLGRTGIEVPIVGLGAMFIGTGPDTGSRDMDEDVGVATVHAAIQAGATLIDTAPLYGMGQSERIIARAFRERPDLRSRCIVQTKVGYLPDGFDYSRDKTLRCVEGSQERLEMETFDVVYIHDAKGQPMGKVMGRDGALGALRNLQDQGIVRHIGTATNHPPTNADYIETGEFDAAVLAHAYSLLNLTAEDRTFAAADRHDVGLVIATPLERGLLATGPRNGAAYVARNFSRACLDHVAKIQALCERHRIPLAAAALQWCVREPRAAAAIPGARTPEEARANARAAEVAIPEAFWDDLRPLVRHWEQGVDR